MFTFDCNRAIQAIPELMENLVVEGLPAFLVGKVSLAWVDLA
jgi:hypothetical protein